jgi:hypothetical protein
MAEGERATGTPNTIYDLSSVLFHALEGGASYDQYIQDAEEVGDQELADFFIQVRDEDSMRADEAQRLIAERTPAATRTEGATYDASPRPHPSSEFPGTEPLAEEVSTARGGGAPPPPEEIPPERAGEIPTAEEVPPPRTEEVTEGTSTQASSRDVRSGSPGEALPRTEESAGEQERWIERER